MPWMQNVSALHPSSGVTVKASFAMAVEAQHETWDSCSVAACLGEWAPYAWPLKLVMPKQPINV